MSETELMREILVAVSRVPGVLAWRNNSALLRSETGARVRASVPGAPDIIAIRNGAFIGIEVKTERGRQSEQQRNFQAACERAGGRYVLARSVADAMEAIG